MTRLTAAELSGQEEWAGRRIDIVRHPTVLSCEPPANALLVAGKRIATLWQFVPLQSPDSESFPQFDDASNGDLHAVVTSKLLVLKGPRTDPSTLDLWC